MSLGEIINKHLQDIRAGHDGKLYMEILDYISKDYISKDKVREAIGEDETIMSKQAPIRNSFRDYLRDKLSIEE